MHQVGIEEQLVVVTVGLPATGKTFFSRKILRYLSWLGYKTHNFIIADYRRAMLGQQPSSEFFNPDNLEAKKQREEVRQKALQHMLQFLSEGGNVASYDGVNSSIKNRKELVN